MSIRTKLIAALSLIALVTMLGAATTWLSVQRERAMLATVEVTATRAAAQGLQLVASIKDIQLNIIQVQQWLTDISATRGLDGLDDGFTKAEEHARLFKATIDRATGLAGRLGLEGVGQALRRTEAAFGPYYAVGQRMARGYVEGGTGEGNRLMGEFDATAAALATSMNDLVSQTDQAIAGEVGSLSRALADMGTEASRLLWIATGGGLVALLACIAVGVAVGRGICAPVGAMTAAMHRLAEGDTGVAVPARSRRDEIGEMARALEIFKLNAVEKIRLEAEQRSAAEHAAADRRRTLAEMANTLEQDVGGIVRTVAAEAQALQGAAASMAASADQTNH